MPNQSCQIKKCLEMFAEIAEKKDDYKKSSTHRSATLVLTSWGFPDCREQARLEICTLLSGQ